MCALFCGGPQSGGRTPDRRTASEGPQGRIRRGGSLIRPKIRRRLSPAQAADAKAPDNPTSTWLGYATQSEAVWTALKHYKIALRLAPRHRGANEYLGELYLALGQLKKAEERLAVLDRACLFGCEEYTELKEAIAAYKARKGISE